LKSTQSLKYSSLVAEILTCEKCNLCKTRTQAVPGEGSLKAKIMFVGEGPGKQEDLKGTPFCGASGKLLDALLQSIDLKREDVYITNIVKCRPPNNRDPFDNEKDACSPFLNKQIEQINPLIIATLGRHSMNFFLPQLKISEMHGKPLRRKGQIYIPLYHPAVGLYRASMKEELLKDFQILKKVINKLEKEKTDNEHEEYKQFPLEEFFYQKAGTDRYKTNNS